jgi:hypothetical protein
LYGVLWNYTDRGYNAVIETKPVPELFGLNKPHMDYPGFKPGPPQIGVWGGVVVKALRY